MRIQKRNKKISSVISIFLSQLLIGPSRHPPPAHACASSQLIPADPSLSRAQAAYSPQPRPLPARLGWPLCCQPKQTHVALPGVGRRHILRTLYTPRPQRIHALCRCGRGACRQCRATPHETDQSAEDPREITSSYPSNIR